jgi:aminoglycoside phosphotransferase family enzyme/predicted kinase
LPLATWPFTSPFVHDTRMSAASDLPAYVAALLSPQAYDHPATDLRLHETHISWVVLAGPYAYKVKKPVDFHFLDFSTVERRRAVCDDEVRLNRRLSPDLYLGVVEIVERDGSYHLGGPGRPVEPAVWMRRLPEEGMLPRLLQSGEVDTRLCRHIARVLARFHARADHGPGVDEYGSADTVRANWDENFEQLAPFVPSVLPAETNRAIEDSVRRFFAERLPLLQRRVAEGRIRDGHGDLHAASICVIDGRPRFFDCLEFSARFRCADVAAEVGFLAMDLDHYGRADLAHAFVDAYVRASGDRELPELLSFYRCYRAYVRGKVRCLRLTETIDDAERGAAISEARAYFDLAWAYAGGLRERLLVVTMGLPASGKSTLARALAGRFGMVHQSSDLVRKERAGLRPTERGDSALNTGIYAPQQTRQTYAALRRRAARWLRLGYSVVLDATYGDPAERASIRRLASRAGVRLVMLWCDADDAAIRRRLAARAEDEGTVSDARLEHWPALRAVFHAPEHDEGVVVVESGSSLDVSLEQAIAAVRH